MGSDPGGLVCWVSWGHVFVHRDWTRHTNEARQTPTMGYEDTEQTLNPVSTLDSCPHGEGAAAVWGADKESGPVS